MAQIGEQEHPLLRRGQGIEFTCLGAIPAQSAALLVDDRHGNSGLPAGLDLGMQEEVAVGLFDVAVDVLGPLDRQGKIGRNHCLARAAFAARYGDDHLDRAFELGTCNGSGATTGTSAAPWSTPAPASAAKPAARTATASCSAAAGTSSEAPPEAASRPSAR